MLSQAGGVLPERCWLYPGAEMDTSNPTWHRADRVSCKPLHQRPRVSVTCPVLTAPGAPSVMIRCSVVFVSPSRQIQENVSVVTAASIQILVNSSSDVTQSTLRSRKTLRGTTQNAVTSCYFECFKQRSTVLTHHYYCFKQMSTVLTHQYYCFKQMSTALTHQCYCFKQMSTVLTHQYYCFKTDVHCADTPILLF